MSDLSARSLLHDIAAQFRQEMAAELQKLNDQQRHEVAQKLDQLARFGTMLVLDPANAQRHKDTIDNIVSSLTSIAALAKVRFQARLRDTILRVVGQGVALLATA